MTNQKINDLLQEIYESDSYELKSQSAFQSSRGYDSYRNLLFFKLIKDLELATLLPQRKIDLSDKGRQIAKNGGWIKHLESKKIKVQEKEKEVVSELDLKLRKLESKMRNRIVLSAVVISFLSFIITVLTIEFWNPLT